MDERIQVVEQKLGALENSVETFQESVQGCKEELQPFRRGLQQNLEALTQEIKALALTVQPFGTPMTDVTHLRQTGTVAEFNTKFDQITAKLDLTEAYLVNTYVGALKDEIADSVRLFNPRNLQEARLLARTQEIGVNRKAEKARKALEDQSQNQTPLFIKSETDAASVEQKPEEQEPLVVQETNDNGKLKLRTMRDVGETTKESTFQQRIIVRSVKAFTTEEEAEYREKNLCFFCHEQFSHDHKCAQRQKMQLQLVLLEGDDEDLEPIIQEQEAEDEIETECPCISLHATEGTAHSESMRAWGTLGEQSLQIVMDSGKKSLQRINLKRTWMQEFLFEKSKEQLVCIYFVPSTVSLGGSQLENILFPCQKYFADSLGFLISDEHLGFQVDSAYMSPITSQLGLAQSEYIFPHGLQIWVSILLFSPTQKLLLVWFRGKLIVMLYGRKHCVQSYNVFYFLRDVVSRVPDYSHGYGLGHSESGAVDQAVSKRRKAAGYNYGDSDEESKRSKMHGLNHTGSTGRGRGRGRGARTVERDNYHQEIKPEPCTFVQHNSNHNPNTSVLEENGSESKESPKENTAVPGEGSQSLTKIDLNSNTNEDVNKNAGSTAHATVPEPATETKLEEIPGWSVFGVDKMAIDSKQLVQLGRRLEEEEEDYDEEG